MAPEFEDGSIVVIDPEQTVRHGDYAVARVADEIRLGQMTISDGVLQFSTTSDEGDSMVEIGNMDILGRVVRRTHPRLRSSRDYT